MHFEILKNVAGTYWWQIVGGNGEIMASSQQYTRKQSAKDAIAVVQGNAAGGRTVDSTGE
jgi:uncharacterized protein YegP (UPF0339 family)